MREIYANNNVKTLVNCANLNGMVMTEEFRTNLKVFKEMNGGSASYHTINQNIAQYSGKIEHAFKSIDRIILNEQQSDQSTLQIIGNSNAITPFE